MSKINKKVPQKIWHKNRKKSSKEETLAKELSPNEENNIFNIYIIHKKLGIPYFSWKLFFDNEEYLPSSETVNKIQAMENFIERHKNLSTLTPSNLISFNIDYEELCNDTHFCNVWSTFKIDLQNNPLHTLNCLKLSVHQKILRALPEENLEHLMSSLNSCPTVQLRLLNFNPILNLRDLKVNSYGKLISTKGCVIRIGRIQHLAQWLVFFCLKCGLQKIFKQPNGKYTLPKKCDNCGISKFLPILDSPHNKTIKFQTIRIQESLSEEQEDKGRMPRILDVELFDNMASTCMPGDDVALTGIIKVQESDEASVKKNAGNAFPLYMEAVTLINNKQRIEEKTVVDTGMNLKDYVAIKDVYNKPNIFALLVNSLCPGIYGHEIIKAGLILGLIGGNSNNKEKRDDIHILLVGDPGLGKSQMLQACSRVATKGIFICGNSSTSSGLTVSLTKESGTNDFALEPGALVLADQGCCCIDEFDKMPTQHQALLEAMEQQSVSVAKSGVLCSLPARTSILAAANPIGGRYDRSKSMMANLNMSQPLLSRFDLVFLLLDKPNEQLDSLLCKHVMTFHSGPHTSRNDAASNISFSKTDSKISLREKLSDSLEGNNQIISQSILRNYISYARMYVKPKLSTEAAEVLQEYYLSLRSNQNGLAGFPVYNRQLEAMIRLTEARAKLELRVEATADDALEVIEILQYSTMCLKPDLESPEFLSQDSGKMTTKKVRCFVKELQNNSSRNDQYTFSTNELKEFASKIGIEDFSSLLSRLNDQGVLLKSSGNHYRFIPD
ncbi:DNA helicase MCM8-like [Prorops nasuta]|uniref:DNA helicase MCM8-like n=1 Tax=Prorops nasuta TaxID=863751 RepID=UPI0034CFC0B4